MAILSITTDMIGETGISPKLIRISSSDNLAVITNPGYLTRANLMGNPVSSNDLALISYVPNSSNVFVITIDQNDVITLSLYSSNVIEPSIPNHLVVFKDNEGTIGEATTTSTLPQPMTVTGSVTANLGSLYSYPAGAGGLQLRGNINTGNVDTIVSNKLHAQQTTYKFPDVGQSTGSLMNCKIASDPGSNLIYFSQLVTAQNMNSGGGAQILYPAASPTATYALLSLWTNKGGGIWLGAGVNIEITDTVTRYTLLASNFLQTGSYVNANHVWGFDNPLPFPGSAGITTATSAGKNLIIRYVTVGYSFGSISVSGILVKLTS